LASSCTAQAGNEHPRQSNPPFGSQKDSADNYSAKETQQRVEAAVHGSRLVGHKPQSEMKLGNEDKVPARCQKESPVETRLSKTATGAWPTFGA
jgi:hypothetical protein